jgi:hypothetical protein
MSEKTFKRAARRLMQSMGVVGDLYRSDGTTVANVLLHISRDVTVVSPGQSETSELRNEAEMLVEDVCNLRKRDQIVYGQEVWQVESKVANDGYTIRVVVSEQ